MKVPSRLIVFPEENHWVMRGENSRFFYAEIHAWLARWLARWRTVRRGEPARRLQQQLRRSERMTARACNT